MRSITRNGLTLAVLGTLAGLCTAAEPQPALPQQVQLNVIVVEVDKACLETLGLSRPAAQAPVLFLDTARCQEFLVIRRSLGLARFLAEPCLIAQSGEPAEIQIGQEVPFFVDSEREDVKKAIMVPTGIALRTTPVIVEGQQLKLDVTVQTSCLTKDYPHTGAFTAQKVTGPRNDAPDVFAAEKFKGFPGLVTRNLQTTVEMPRGKTLILSGLTKETDPHATLVLITPSPLVPAAAQAQGAFVTQAPAVGSGPLPPLFQTGGAFTAQRKSPSEGQPAIPPASTTSNASSRLTFTASGDRMAVHSEGVGDHLAAKQMVLPLGVQDLRFAAANGRIMVGCTLFNAVANTASYDTKGRTLSFKGKVEFSSNASGSRTNVEAEELTVNLETAAITIAGCGRIAPAASK